jgi:hypothetical protein
MQYQGGAWELCLEVRDLDAYGSECGPSRDVGRAVRLRVRTRESRPRSEAFVSHEPKSASSVDGVPASVSTRTNTAGWTS